MDELALSIGLVVAPVSFVARSVGPNLNTPAVSHLTKPLSLVEGTIRQRDLSFVNSIRGISIHNLILGEVISLHTSQSSVSSLLMDHLVIDLSLNLIIDMS
jgi:hypothetical protein